MLEKIAAIDLGTNSLRLLIGHVDEKGSIQRVLLRRHITRLGGGFTRERGISAEALDRTIEALHEFSALLKKFCVARYRAVATSAVRDAVNGREFAAKVLEKTGIVLEIIDGRKEAMMTLRGVISGIDDSSGDLLVFDVGGGSTEYTLTRGEKPLFTRSLPLGVVRLTEGKGNREAMVEKIDRELAKLFSDIEKSGLATTVHSATLVGTAGTSTTLAAIHMKMADYDYRRVNNYLLSLDDINAILAELIPMTREERLKVPGLEKGREDLIIAGILITLKTMDKFGFRKLKASDSGLLEGLMLST
jgi:exopolyphosphatase/guanosine-5'-triphosphate,3'-diphosphate pyrophosphatase